MRLAYAPLSAQWSRVALVAVLLVNLVLAFVSINIVHAAAFTVNSIVDAGDANPGDGVCEIAANSGICTLRAAIQETNATAATGPHTITLPNGNYVLTIVGQNEDGAATGDLDIKSNLTINGEDQTNTVIDGGAIDRVLQVFEGFTATITGVTIQNGNPGTGDGGGILNVGTLTLSSSTVRNNTVSARIEAVAASSIMVRSRSQTVQLAGTIRTRGMVEE